MGAMIGLSALLVVAMGTTTMAWYSVQTSISVQSSSVSIRTALQYEFYAFRGNGFTDGLTNYAAYAPGSGYSSAPTTIGVSTYQLNPLDANVEDHYCKIDALKFIDGTNDGKAHQDAYYDALTSVSGLWPGYKMSFAIRIDGLQEGDNPALDIIKANIIPGVADGTAIPNTNPTAYWPNRPTNTDGHVTMAEAITIDAGTGATLSAAVTAATAINHASQVPNTEWWDSGHLASDGNIGTESRITIGNANGRNPQQNTSWWYFFTIGFSNAQGTYYTYNSGTGYYGSKGDDGGNSSCYEGLPFKLGVMELK